MSLKKTLFLSENYPPMLGGTCNKFESRFGFYSPEKVIVLTKNVDKAEKYDCNVQYHIERVPLQWGGLQGFEWVGIVKRFVKRGIYLARKHKVENIECARPLPEGVAGYVIAKLLFKKLVINFQGEDIGVLQNYRVEKFTMKKIIQAAHLNIANSKYTEDLIKGLGGERAKTAISYPGFRSDILLTHFPDSAKILQLRNSFFGKPVLLTLGRLQQRKGQDNTIRALPEVIKQFPDVRYIVVGSSHGGTEGLAESLKQLAQELNISKNVIVVGEIEKEKIPLYYNACDLFVMPNRVCGNGDVEGFGQVFLEAGFMEKPVIGGNSGGVPDAVKHGKTGLLVDGNSIYEISQAILQILKDKNKARIMGKNGKQFAITMTPEKIFEKYQKTLGQWGL